MLARPPAQSYGRNIHAHKSKERPIVKHLSSQRITENKRARKTNHSDEQNVVAGNAVPGMDSPEEALWQSAVLPHGKQQPRSAKLGRYARAHICEQQRCVDNHEED